MNYLLSAVVLILGLIVGCASSPEPPKISPATELDQLVVLYKQSRPKFVIQKQKMIQANTCNRATRLHNEAKSRIKAAEMSPETNNALIAVQRELAQAENECRKK